MGTVNSNFLPASAGLWLGSGDQPWNAALNNLNLPNIVVPLGTVQGSFNVPISSALSMVTMTLSGNASPTVSGTPGIVMFAISQNSVGGYSLTWPAGTVNGMTVGTDANQVSYQLFLWDGSVLSAMTPGLVSPASTAPTAPTIYATPGESVAHALTRLPSSGGRIIFDAGTYPSGGAVISTANITLEGSGKPSFNSGYTALTGGTIIQGKLVAQQGAHRLTVRDLGIDCGSALGIASDVFGIFNVGQVVGGTPVDSPIIENVACLGFSPSTSAHCLLLENVTNASVRNVSTVYNIHGLVIKGTGVNIDGVYSRGHSNDAIIFKSDDYAPCADVNLSNFLFAYLQTPGDTAGIIIQGAEAGISNINITNGSVVGISGSGIYIQGATALAPASAINISNVTIDYNTAAPTNTFGIQLTQYVARVSVSNSNFFNLWDGIAPNLPVVGQFNDFSVSNCHFVNVTNRGIHSYGRWVVTACSFISVATAFYNEFDTVYLGTNYFASVTTNYAGSGTFSGNGPVISGNGVFGTTKTVTIAATSTPVALGALGGTGLLRVRDNTSGGAAVFLIDPNGGSQLLGTSQITGLAAAQVTWAGSDWNLALSSGTVPRVLTWTIYG